MHSITAWYCPDHSDSWLASDSVAAFLAAGIEQPGEAVSSLGSTLAIDLLSTCPIDAAQYGICSYRWKDLWIIGEAQQFSPVAMSVIVAPCLQCTPVTLTCGSACIVCSYDSIAYLLALCLCSCRLCSPMQQDCCRWGVQYWWSSLETVLFSRRTSDTEQANQPRSVIR